MDDLERILNDQLRERVGPSRYREIQREHARELARRALDWLGTDEASSVWERMHKMKADCARRMDERRVDPADMDIEYEERDLK